MNLWHITKRWDFFGWENKGNNKYYPTPGSGLSLVPIVMWRDELKGLSPTMNALI